MPATMQPSHISGQAWHRWQVMLQAPDSDLRQAEKELAWAVYVWPGVNRRWGFTRPVLL